MSDYGLSIAPQGSGASREPGMTLQDKATQFKYAKAVYIDVAFPITPVSSGQSQTINYFHGLGYKPSFLTYIKGHTWDANERWGLAYRGGTAINAGGDPNFPYSVFDEYSDAAKYSARFQVYNIDPGVPIPAHTIRIRLAVLFDELATV